MSETVVIAGGGPVGLMLAGELALASVQVIVVEREPEPRVDVPGSALNAAVVELLDQRGLMNSLRSDGFEFPQAHFGHVWLDPTVLPERHEFTFVVPHSQLIARLEEHAIKLGVEIRRGYEVVSISQDDRHAAVGIRSTAGTGQTPMMTQCRYVVGCDGASSAVRELAGIEFPGTDSPFYGIIGDLELEPSAELLEWLGVHQLPLGLCMIGPAGPGVLRVATGEFDVNAPDPDAAVTLTELHAHLRRLTGIAPDLGKPIWLSRWHNTTRHAEHYRAGRVFLAGDSAHVHFPLGGQALSTGIEDAVNLGWKIAAEIAGWAPEGLLDTYHAERHPVGARACHTTRAQVALMHPMSRVEPLRDVLSELVKFDNVNEYFVKMAGGLDVRYPMPGTHPLLGRRLPAVNVQTPDGWRSIAELLTAGRGVLLTFGAEVPGEVSGWADRVDVVHAEPTSEIGAGAVLLRPDGRVAWTDTAGVDLLSQLAAWLGAPKPGAVRG
jgi:2-polyprenyl-6-methoxyphenol hydroxylase-like FAD-dependent oxidoreductase